MAKSLGQVLESLSLKLEVFAQSRVWEELQSNRLSIYLPFPTACLHVRRIDTKSHEDALHDHE